MLKAKSLIPCHAEFQEFLMFSNIPLIKFQICSPSPDTKSTIPLPNSVRKNPLFRFHARSQSPVKMPIMKSSSPS